jgi:uncharacterized membrane protein YhaH (DUF805 family)
MVKDGTMKSKLDLLRKIFLVVFILSSLMVSLLYLFKGAFFQFVSSNEEYLILEKILSLFPHVVTSLVALLGFVVTTALSFRREKREMRESELALKQKEMELEKMRLELEELKRKLGKKSK